MKKGLSLLLAVMMLVSLAACAADSGDTAADTQQTVSGTVGTESADAGSNEQAGPDTTFIFTDSCGRQVELPVDIQRVAPSGAVATMILAAAAPDKMVSVANALDDGQAAYLPESLFGLDATGQLYGSKSTLNLEQLLALDPQVMIDFGDYKESIAAYLDAFTEQTGIPAIFIEADLDSMEAAFRTLGTLLNCEEHCNAVADLVAKTMNMAAENSAKLSDDQRVSVMFTTGTDGLGTNARGSVHAQVLDIVGVVNAIVVDEVSNKGGGNQINMEQLYIFDPDIIVMSPEVSYEMVTTDTAWAQLTAVRNGQVYVIPSVPYNWLANPPSMNMILGVWWLGNIAYPELYDYDMVTVAQECYETLWGYELSTAEAQELLGLN